MLTRFDIRSVKEWVQTIAESTDPAAMSLLEINQGQYQVRKEWETDIQVSVEEIGEFFSQFSHLEHPEYNSHYVIPLHGTDDPMPTGEYVLYSTIEQSPSISYYCKIFRKLRSSAVKEIEQTYLSKRMRFWHPDHPPAQPPQVPDADTPLPPPSVRATTPIPQSEQNVWFDEMYTFVETERETERKAGWETFTDNDRYRLERRNQAVSGLVPIGTQPSREHGTLYVCQKDVSDDTDDAENVDITANYGIYPKTDVILDSDTRHAGFPLEARVVFTAGNEIGFNIDWSTTDNQSAVKRAFDSESEVLWAFALLNPVPYERRLTALKQLQATKIKRGLLTGDRSPRFKRTAFNTITPEISLNKWQQTALNWADAAEDLLCIHGPPGTGKTRILTAIIKHTVDSGERVLVTAHSNQAVDNLLVGDSTIDDPEEGTLHALAQPPEDSEDPAFRIARVGSNSRNSVVKREYVGENIDLAQVVASTTSGAARFDRNEFDVAIVDEATQASRPSTAIVVNAANKIILAGDHKQLPPYCADERSKEEAMHISLFEHLLNIYHDDIAVPLRRQYRMNEVIATFPNKAFYDGILEHGERNRDWRIDGLTPLMGVDIDGREVWDKGTKSRQNPTEAQLVTDHVKLLVQSGVKPSDIGVITAYAAQKETVKSALERLDIEGIHRTTVDTVDSFQGGEREAIIVSFVRSNEDGNSGFLEFPDEGPRRLNVALTRARRRCVLIGNWETLSTRSPHRSDAESCADVYAALREHLETNELMKRVSRSQVEQR